MKKILIVDDSAALRTSVEFTLSEQGYDVLQAEDGSKGLAVLTGMAGKESELGMIISDINMPNMDGISFIKEVKKTAFKFTPILVLTTESQDSKKMEGKEAGASGWLVKPFKPEQLMAVVSKFLK
ncbi:MAG: response regulator [Spirochaetales bacterium]|nr:response regulator [Spirochaetales bacterium]